MGFLSITLTVAVLLLVAGGVRVSTTIRNAEDTIGKILWLGYGKSQRDTAQFVLRHSDQFPPHFVARADQIIVSVGPHN